MQNSFRWDDLQVLLALARENTLTSAAARLGVNASTVGRRLDTLEEALGTTLFDRSPDGVVATLAAEKLVPIAEAMERVAADVTRTQEGFETRIEGEVRITAPPGAINHFVAPRIVRLRKKHPRLRVILDASVSYADLTRREADIAIRVSRPTVGDLVATKLGVTRSLILASPAYARKVCRVADLDDLSWITWGPELANIPDAAWLRRHVDERRFVMQTSSVDTQLSAAVSGLGALLLPPVYRQFSRLIPVELAPTLKRKLPPPDEASLWLVGHQALRRVPRVAAVWEFLLVESADLFG